MPTQTCDHCECESTDLNSCGCCSDHCGCDRCGACGDCSSDLCRHCDECENCCSCRICSDCSQLADCDDCGRCSDCCMCSHDSDDEDDDIQLGSPWDYPVYSKFKCKRLIGVEWEYNTQFSEIRQWARKWRGGIHYDGSCGHEAVTAPISGDNIDACLNDLGRLLSSKTTCDNRCGVHVHVDAKDYRWSDMYRLLWVYGKIEPLLYLLAGQGRTRISYCKPVGKDYAHGLSELDRKSAVLAVATGAKADGYENGRKYLRSHKVGKKDGGRYRGLNILPWLAGRSYPAKTVTTDRKTGKKITTFKTKNDTTIEFRMHKNTQRADRVIGWAKLCARIVDWCANATDKEAQALPKSALRALCDVIAPDCKPWILMRINEWRKATQTRVSNSRRYRPTTRQIVYKPETGYAIRA